MNFFIHIGHDLFERIGKHHPSFDADDARRVHAVANSCHLCLRSFAHTIVHARQGVAQISIDSQGLTSFQVVLQLTLQRRHLGST